MPLPHGKEKVIKDMLDRGCYLFGLVSGRKIPKKEFTNWQNVAFNDYDAIKKSPVWSIYDNVGISCGLSNIVVIDQDKKVKVDKKTGKKTVIDGVTAFNKLCAKLGVSPLTYTVETPSGGSHAYFSNPRHYPIKSDQGTDKRGLGVGIDIRAEGGYVVAAGQYLINCKDHEAGRYTVKIQSEFKPLPEALATHILNVQSKNEPSKKAENKDTGKFKYSTRNEHIIKVGFSYLDPDCPRDEWRDIIWSLRYLVTDCGWDETLVKSFIKEWSIDAVEYNWSDAEAEFERIWAYHDESRTSDYLKIGTYFHKVNRGQQNPYWMQKEFFRLVGE